MNSDSNNNYYCYYYMGADLLTHPSVWGGGRAANCPSLKGIVPHCTFLTSCPGYATRFKNYFVNNNCQVALHVFQEINSCHYSHMSNIIFAKSVNTHS